MRQRKEHTFLTVPGEEKSLRTLLLGPNLQREDIYIETLKE